MADKTLTGVVNLGLDEKRKLFEASPYVLTSMVGSLADWTAQNVEDRQARLAKFALKAWPL